RAGNVFPAAVHVDIELRGHVPLNRAQPLPAPNGREGSVGPHRGIRQATRAVAAHAIPIEHVEAHVHLLVEERRAQAGPSAPTCARRSSTRRWTWASTCSMGMAWAATARVAWRMPRCGPTEPSRPFGAGRGWARLSGT